MKRASAGRAPDTQRKLQSRNSIVADTPQLIVALRGSEGTLEEINLARRFGTAPVIGYLESRDEIERLSDDVVVISDSGSLERAATSELNRIRATG